jgi:hypothetical protein
MGDGVADVLGCGVGDVSTVSFDAPATDLIPLEEL